MDRSFGERMVRKSFNPSELEDVKEAKRKCAELLDFCYNRQADNPLSPARIEQTRLLKHAIMRFEEGCMWLVKALTVEQ